MTTPLLDPLALPHFDTPTPGPMCHSDDDHFDMADDKGLVLAGLYLHLRGRSGLLWADRLSRGATRRAAEGFPAVRRRDPDPKAMSGRRGLADAAQ